MKKIYEAMDFADTAYIMQIGKVTFILSQDDKFSLEGKGIIFGTEEPLIAYKMGIEDYFRFQSVFAEDDAAIDKIPLKNLYKLISIYNIGYNITKNIAKYLQITNRIYIGKEKKLSGQEMASKEYARIYVQVIEDLRECFTKYRIGWLSELIEKYANSLVYTKGRAFLGGSAGPAVKFKTEASDLNLDLNPGAILCEEGDPSREMFILNRGNLQVSIGGKKVADINEVGTVIGEMALLLGEKRTATIKAVTGCNITIIRPENLEEVATKDKDFLLNMAVNLGKRLEHNCTLIRETNEILRESMDSEVPVPPKERNNYRELLKMVSELDQYEMKYKNDWMIALLKKTKQDVGRVREMYG